MAISGKAPIHFNIHVLTETQVDQIVKPFA